MNSANRVTKVMESVAFAKCNSLNHITIKLEGGPDEALFAELRSQGLKIAEGNTDNEFRVSW
jgi:hypothetical protein